MHEIQGGIKMIVFHTSNTIVVHPDIRFSRAALDFGKGFYVTALREQAVNYAEKFHFKSQPAILNIYELNENWRQGNVLRFDSYDEAWLDFVIANRRQQPVNIYDAVEGGVANDKVFRTLELYFSGDIPKETALKRLQYEKPNHQICLLNQDFIDLNLTYLKHEVL